jgi:hypothetical protein
MRRAQNVNDSDPQHHHLLDAVIARQLARLTSTLTTSANAPDPDQVMAVLLMAVPSADHGGLTLLRERRAPLSLGPRGEVPWLVDRLQHACQEGPFHAPPAAHGVVLVDDLASDPRWLTFGPECLQETGVRSMLCLRMALGGTDRAALVLYASRPHAFDEGDVTTSSLLAPFAALAAESYLRAHDVDNLRAALGTSRQIGTAVGILMARRRVSSEEAFALVRKASMDLNRKVHDIAVEVVTTGDLPVTTSSLEGGQVDLT